MSFMFKTRLNVMSTKLQYATGLKSQWREIGSKF